MDVQTETTKLHRSEKETVSFQKQKRIFKRNHSCYFVFHVHGYTQTHKARLQRRTKNTCMMTAAIRQIYLVLKPQSKTQRLWTPLQK